MICIVGTRRAGKITALIKVSEETGLPIVTATAHMAKSIQDQAESMGATIPRPYARQFMNEKIGLRGHVLVDEAQMILERVIGLPVDVCVFEASHFEFADMSLLEVIAAWWRSRRVEKIEVEEI